MKLSITTELVRRLRQHPPATAIDVWDTKLPRFVLRVRPSGRHSYLVLLGRGRWYTLGSVEALKPPQARKQAQKRLGEVASGLDPQQAKRAAHQPTLADYVDQTYKPWLLANRRSGETLARHISTVFGETMGRLRLGELSAWHVERWRIGRLKEGVTPATTNRDLSSLRALLNRAVDWGHLDKHPLVKVKALPEDKIGRLRFLSPEEETRLRESLLSRDTRRREARDRANTWRSERDYTGWPPYGTYTDHLTPLVLLALQTGLRFGELTGMRWRDVDLVNSLLTVATQNAKSGRARHVPLNKEASDVLRSCRPDPIGVDDFVFPGVDGARLVDIKTAWKPLLRAANIERFRFHDLRHTFASKLAMAGVDLNTVRELLGHSNITMTLRYAHLAPEHRAAAVAKLMHA